jgi:hypothetical protein
LADEHPEEPEQVARELSDEVLPVELYGETAGTV